MTLQSLLLSNSRNFVFQDGAKTAVREMEGRGRRKSFTRREDTKTRTA